MAFTKKSSFISVEIAIKTDHDSKAFVEWFEGMDNYVNKIEHEPEKWYIYCDPIHGASANEVILKLCEMIKGFPPKVRLDWDRATHREFYAGYYGGEQPGCFEEHISPATIEATTAVKAGIGFALYPAFPTDEEGFTEDFYENEESEQDAAPDG